MAGKLLSGKSYEEVELDVLVPEHCEGCGLCCEGIGSPVIRYKSLDDPQRPHPVRPAGLPEHLIREIDEEFGGLRRGQEPQERCLWFDPVTRACKHYEWRPPACRDYELAGQACLTDRELWFEYTAAKNERSA